MSMTIEELCEKMGVESSTLTETDVDVISKALGKAAEDQATVGQSEDGNGLFAKALSAVVGLLRKGTKKAEEDEDEDEDEEDKDEDARLKQAVKDLNLGEDEDEEKETTKDKIKKSLAEDKDVEELVSADELVKAVMVSATGAYQAIADSQTKVLTKLAKAIRVQANQIKTLNEKLDGIGQRPVSALAPYQVLQKGIAAEGTALPDKATAMKQAEVALKKSLITPAERRQVELAYDQGAPAAAASVLARIRTAE